MILNDPALLWLALTSADPRYLDCLTMEVCRRWCHDHNYGQNRTDLPPTYTIDNKGDAFAWAWTDSTMDRYDSRFVVREGVVQPCTDAIATYLRTYTARRANTPP